MDRLQGSSKAERQRVLDNIHQIRRISRLSQLFDAFLAFLLALWPFMRARCSYMMISLSLPVALNIMKVWHLRFPATITIRGSAWSKTPSTHNHTRKSQNSVCEETVLMRKNSEPDRKVSTPVTPCHHNGIVESSPSRFTPPESPMFNENRTPFPIVVDNSNSSIVQTKDRGYTHLDASMSRSLPGEQQLKLIFNPFETELPPLVVDMEP